jgi:hypothetical protein
MDHRDPNVGGLNVVSDWNREGGNYLLSAIELAYESSSLAREKGGIAWRSTFTDRFTMNGWDAQGR